MAESDKTTAAEKAEQDAQAQALKAAEAAGEAEQARLDAEQQKADEAQKATDAAVEKATDKNGAPKTDKEGRIVGLDGKNPVSNTNPDPRCVRGTHTL